MSSGTSKSERQFESAKIFIPLVGLFIICILLGIYFFKFNGSLGTNSDFGAFGDFLGGLLNPVLTFLTILLLIYSITFQLDELKETRKEIVRSRNDIKENNQINKSRADREYQIFQASSLSSEFETIDKIILSIFQHYVRNTKAHGIQTLSDCLDDIRNSESMLRNAVSRQRIVEAVIHFEAISNVTLRSCLTLKQKQVDTDYMLAKMHSVYSRTKIIKYFIEWSLNSEIIRPIYNTTELKHMENAYETISRAVAEIEVFIV
jgi:hypothetical protein